MTLPRVNVRETRTIHPVVTIRSQPRDPVVRDAAHLVPRTSVDIAADRDAAVAERTALEGSRSDLLLTGTADEVAALDRRIAVSKIRIDAAEMQHSAAVIAEAKARSDHEAEQSRRKVLRKAGMKASAEAAKLADRYIVLAREMAGVLGQLRAQEGRIAEVNAALPDGAEPVPPGEPFNGTETIPMRSETTHDLVWVDTRTGQPAGILAGNDLRHRVAKTIERRVAVPSIPGEPHVPLSHRVTLPGLGRDAPPIWRSLPQPLRSDTGYRA
ncbi:hypothetical protein MKK64_12015 [Methylobacterium sp. E-025]|uniref:hypothetical protein n=1 Tax=Methylobacterium sp. E-025 TaxID=2836561 RepID=UPI001FB91DDA|nr:hypothetical protein [Methylobacterium sp. E-025]MCJ2111922.1 hypothetical protein [Methylobacterium sp. E-025]